MPVAELKVCWGGGSFQFQGKIAGFPPFAGAVMVDEEFGVDAEGILTVVIDPTAGRAGREAKIASLVLPFSKGLIEGSVIGDVALQNIDGASSDDGEGRGVVGGEVADGVKENKVWKVGKLPDEISWVANQGGKPGSEGRRNADHRNRNSVGFRECKALLSAKVLPLTCPTRSGKVWAR